MINKTETFSTFSNACHFIQTKCSSLFFFQSQFFLILITHFQVQAFGLGGTHFFGAQTQEEKILEHGWDVRGFTPAPPQGCS